MSILLFLLLLMVSFAVLVYFLRPTATETAVQQHLDSIEEKPVQSKAMAPPSSGGKRSAIPCWIDELIREMPGSVGLARLIRQAGQTWQVSSVLLVSVALANCGCVDGVARHPEPASESGFWNRCGLSCPIFTSRFAGR